MTLNFRPQGPGASGPVSGDSVEGAYQCVDNWSDVFFANERSMGPQAAQRFLECAHEGMAAFAHAPGLDATATAVLDPVSSAQVLPGLEIVNGDAAVASAQMARPMTALGGRAASLFDGGLSKAAFNPATTSDIGSAFTGALDGAGNMPFGFLFKFLEFLTEMLGQLGEEALRAIETYEEAAVASLRKLKV